MEKEIFEKNSAKSLNFFAEFRDKSLEFDFLNSFWKTRKQSFFISYFICTILFFFHGFFDFKREFVTGSAEALMFIRTIFLFLCLHFIWFYKKRDDPKYLYEYCLVLKLISVLIILLLTIFTGGVSKTLHIGTMIMCASFYVVLPSKALYSLLSSITISSVYIFLGDRTDTNFMLISFIIVASNIILWFFCKNQHRYNRLDYIHQQNLSDIAEMKSKMLTVLAHDIRTPLSVILLRSSLGASISKNDQLKKFEDHFSSIEKNTKKIEALIKDLLNWTFSDNHMTHKQYEIKAPISSTIKSSIQYLEEAAKIKNIRIVTDIEEREIKHDQIMVETIIRNLLSNSIKFSDAHSIIKIKAYFEDRYLIKLYDTGGHLTKEQIKKIQKGEIQKSQEGTEGEKGYGVGLALVHSFLSIHNANLNVTPNPEGGNIFEISFPK